MQIGLLKTSNDDDYEIFSSALILTFRFSYYGWIFDLKVRHFNCVKFCKVYVITCYINMIKHDF